MTTPLLHPVRHVELTNQEADPHDIAQAAIEHAKGGHHVHISTGSGTPVVVTPADDHDKVVEKLGASRKPVPTGAAAPRGKKDDV